MPLKIVYLDDEVGMCEMFADNYNSEAIQVSTYVDADAAIAAMAAETPDLVFIDYRLPSTNGDLVAQKLDPAVPKVLVTGDLQVNVTYKFLKILGKPFDFADVDALIAGIGGSGGSGGTVAT